VQAAQTPFTQAGVGVSHETQAAPPAPQAALLVAVTHVSPWQQPVHDWAQVIDDPGRDGAGGPGCFFFFFRLFFSSWTRA
jgi:hypothetical protein